MTQTEPAGKLVMDLSVVDECDASLYIRNGKPDYQKGSVIIATNTSECDTKVRKFNKKFK